MTSAKVATDERKRKAKVDNEDARMTKHDCAHMDDSEEDKKMMLMLMIFRGLRALEDGINRCQGLCTTGMI